MISGGWDGHKSLQGAVDKFDTILPPVNTGALVVASQQKEVVRVFQFVGEEKTNRLEGILASGTKSQKMGCSWS